MSHRFIWRSTTIIITLLLIYLAFPVLLVPSSLPAIQAIFLSKIDQPAIPGPSRPFDPNTIPIYQLEPTRQLTTKEKFTALKQLHRQGIQIIFKR